LGQMFRSEEMCLVQLFFQTESAHTCIHQLGLLGLAQFRDLNPGTAAFQRKFVKEVKRCEEMERILRFLEAEMARCAIPVSAVVDSGGVTCPRELLELECKIRKLEEELKEINCNHDALKRNFTELLEISSLLKTFAQSNFTPWPYHLPLSLLFECTPSTWNRVTRRRGEILPLRIGTTLQAPDTFIAGVIKQDRFPAFEKVLWRLFHENFILRHAEIQDTEQQTENTMVKKDAFVIFVQGDQVQGKIKKICDGFRASLYPCPNTLSAREQMRMSVHIRIEDLRMILRRTEEFRATVLTKAATSIQHWVNKVKKMKAIYYTLNLCNIDITQKLIVAEIWCPVSDLNSVQNALIKGSEQSGSSVSPILNRIHTQHTPPTFNRTNVFTKGFQTIVDAYGVSNYREVNPTPYTIITFPFLFAVMFGDCGHGLVLTLLAVWVIAQQKKETFLGYFGRFIILLMGLFSIYTGLIYNDCFSKSFSIYGSSWSVRHMFQPSGPWSNETLHSSGHLTLDPAVPRVYSGSPYMLGIDPVWNIASNKLSFLNSYKMKMSVILGVSHMLFGTTLSLVNYIHFRNFQNILLRFIPELVFMLSLFGYLIFLIVFKWCVQLRSETAPSILLMFINMMLFSYQSSDVFLYSEQKAVQTFLVLQALLMVPVMLLVKPLLIYRQRIKLRLQVGGHMGDIFAYQAIYTIEHCLGCISNTASYLRLWALSLAHAELSEVLWRMLLRGGLRCTPGLGAVLLALVLCCFALLTVAVLIVMEGLSAFLHALRLHCNKYKFVPFNQTKGTFSILYHCTDKQYIFKLHIFYLKARQFWIIKFLSHI
uniref:V-type proton ATPase subunit a n=1 Tax=Astyanax mexicanus TaxID=7994 RepID=A0A8B9HNP2_ASTMX